MHVPTRLDTFGRQGVLGGWLEPLWTGEVSGLGRLGTARALGAVGGGG